MNLRTGLSKLPFRLGHKAKQVHPYPLSFLSSKFSQDVKLGLNCVGGKTTTLMARLLGENSHLVSYGAMSKEPLSLPTSLFIFRNLTCHGFWQTRWYNQKTLDERVEMMNTLTDLIRQGKASLMRHYWTRFIS